MDTNGLAILFLKLPGSSLVIRQGNPNRVCWYYHNFHKYSCQVFRTTKCSNMQYLCFCIWVPTSLSLIKDSNILEMWPKYNTQIHQYAPSGATLINWLILAYCSYISVCICWTIRNKNLKYRNDKLSFRLFRKCLLYIRSSTTDSWQVKFYTVKCSVQYVSLSKLSILYYWKFLNPFLFKLVSPQYRY